MFCLLMVTPKFCRSRKKIPWVSYPLVHMPLFLKLWGQIIQPTGFKEGWSWKCPQDRLPKNCLPSHPGPPACLCIICTGWRKSLLAIDSGSSWDKGNRYSPVIMQWGRKPRGEPMGSLHSSVVDRLFIETHYSSAPGSQQHGHHQEPHHICIILTYTDWVCKVWGQWKSAGGGHWEDGSPVGPRAGPGQWRLLTPSPFLGIYILSIIPMVGAMPRMQPWEVRCCWDHLDCVHEGTQFSTEAH